MRILSDLIFYHSSGFHSDPQVHNQKILMHKIKVKSPIRDALLGGVVMPLTASLQAALITGYVMRERGLLSLLSQIRQTHTFMTMVSVSLLVISTLIQTVKSWSTPAHSPSRRMLSEMWQRRPQPKEPVLLIRSSPF